MKTGTGEDWRRHLEPDVAHEVCNIMVDVLHCLEKREDGLGGVLVHIDDDVMADFQQYLCDRIEPHVKFIYADGYNDGDFEAQS